MRRLVKNLEFWTKDTSARAYLTSDPLAFCRESAPGVRNYGGSEVGQSFRMSYASYKLGQFSNLKSSIYLLVAFIRPEPNTAGQR